MGLSWFKPGHSFQWTFSVMMESMLWRLVVEFTLVLQLNCVLQLLYFTYTCIVISGYCSTTLLNQKFQVPSNIIKEVNLILNITLSTCGISINTWSESIQLCQLGKIIALVLRAYI